MFTLVGEGHQDELQLYVKCALKYYKNQLSACGLPASNSNATVSTEILHFPSKLACFEDVFAVSDTGNHSIVIFDSCGYIKVSACTIQFQTLPCLDGTLLNKQLTVQINK